MLQATFAIEVAVYLAVYLTAAVKQTSLKIQTFPKTSSTIQIWTLLHIPQEQARHVCKDFSLLTSDIMIT